MFKNQDMRGISEQQADLQFFRLDRKFRPKHDCRADYFSYLDKRSGTNIFSCFLWDFGSICAMWRHGMVWEWNVHGRIYLYIYKRLLLAVFVSKRVHILRREIHDAGDIHSAVNI